MAYARERGHRAEKIARAGELDEGDVWVELPSGLWVIQCKATRRMDLLSAVRDAQAQARNFAAARGLAEIPQSCALYRPPGYGQARIGEWIAAQTVDALFDRTA